jgi:hypothetical protein
MPVYQYRVVGSKIGDEIIEIEQAVGADELRVHPITGETIKKIISGNFLNLKPFFNKGERYTRKE